MDKALSHQLARQNGIEVSPFVVFAYSEIDQKRESLKRLHLPCFVKPARGGSSIGITKINTWEELDAACACAAKHDRRILIEEAVSGEEIGCSILETPDGLVLGAVDRIHLNSDFFDYEEKYVDTHAEVECPAQLPGFRQRTNASPGTKALGNPSLPGTGARGLFPDPGSADLIQRDQHTARHDCDQPVPAHDGPGRNFVRNDSGHVD